MKSLHTDNRANTVVCRPNSQRYMIRLAVLVGVTLSHPIGCADIPTPTSPSNDESREANALANQGSFAYPDPNITHNDSAIDVDLRLPRSSAFRGYSTLRITVSPITTDPAESHQSSTCTVTRNDSANVDSQGSRISCRIEGLTFSGQHQITATTNIGETVATIASSSFSVFIPSSNVPESRRITLSIADNSTVANNSVGIDGTVWVLPENNVRGVTVYAINERYPYGRSVFVCGTEIAAVQTASEVTWSCNEGMALPDGQYTLRAEFTASNMENYAAQKRIIVDGNTPSALLTWPIDASALLSFQLPANVVLQPRGIVRNAAGKTIRVTASGQGIGDAQSCETVIPPSTDGTDTSTWACDTSLSFQFSDQAAINAATLRLDVTAFDADQPVGFADTIADISFVYMTPASVLSLPYITQ